MSVDVIAALRTVLLANPAVTALVVDRVGGDDVPAGQVKNMPQSCVLLNPSGGPGGDEGYNEFGWQRVDVFCHGATLTESWQVYLAVYTALKQMRRQVAANVLLHSAEPVSKGARGTDPVTEWPTTLSSWQILASEVVAA